jgi:D-alanine-D-alanine ligase
MTTPYPSEGKLRIAVLCGGRSGEHEVSLLSARSVIAALQGGGHGVIVVGIGKDGRWHLQADPRALLAQADAASIQIDLSGPPVVLPADPEAGGLLVLDEEKSTWLKVPVDLCFPVLHGPYGEDGTVQGLLELAGLPYVGAGVLGSAVGMDKDVMKRLLREAGLPTPRFMVVYQRRWNHDAPRTQQAIWEDFEPPVFVKPANLGSSVGVTKVVEREGLPAALELAFQYDTKAIIEEGIVGREIECAVLGNDTVSASVLGEIVPREDFYSYEAKYLDEEGASLIIPADLPENVAEQIRNLAIAAYRVLCCEGMGRMDFFYTNDGRPLISEINSIPGFTRISMYPKLWEATGLDFPRLLDRLIELALERHERRRRLRIDHP